MSEPIPAFTPEVAEVLEAQSISLFDARPGSRLELSLSFDEDAGKTGRMVMEIDQPARHEDWNRGSFTVLEADLTFESTIGELVGKTGSIDAAVTYRPGLMPPFTLGKVAHVTKGRDLLINFDIPGQPTMVNRWIPFVLDCNLTPPDEN